MRRHFYLYGPPGAGKTAVGRALASDLGLPFVDLDAAIETSAGSSVETIFAEQGEAAFRRMEACALSDLPHGGEVVVALGGGTLLDEANRAHALGSGSIICLQATHDSLEQRLEADDRRRPLLVGGNGRLRALLAERSTHYASFPSSVQTSGQTPGEVAREVAIHLGAFHVKEMGPGYDVRLVSGGLDALGEHLSERRLTGSVGSVSDRNVSRRHGSRLADSLAGAGLSVHSTVLPPGESTKRLSQLNRLWRGWLEAGLDRGSTIVAFGGGVIGDLTGFAASTFLRGVAWVNLPTTLLAMVDASLGGKTGINLPQGKNLAGAFYPPRLVLADPELLQTLPIREWRSGMAEVVKHGIVGDPELFARCRDGLGAARAASREIVSRGMAVKIQMIQADPWEAGVRAALNFGHTIGHAVELVLGYRLRHGEAISIGMLAEARLAERIGLAQPGLAEDLQTILAGLGLPTVIPASVSREALAAAAGFDKKRTANEVRFSLPRRVGEVVVGVKVDGWQRMLTEELG